MGEILEADIAHKPIVIDRGQSPRGAQAYQAADGFFSLTYQENFGYAAPRQRRGSEFSGRL